MRSLCPLILLSVCITCSTVVAASKSDKADRVVNALLEQEARGEVHHRRNQLGDLVDQTDRARWAAGYVKTADGWQRFDTPPPTDERLREYETRRGTEPLTAEQHLQLANWCREKELVEQERAHLWTVAAENPTQTVIWNRLGYKTDDAELVNASMRRKRQLELQRLERNLQAWGEKSINIRRRLSAESSSVQAAARRELTEYTDVDALPAFEKNLSTNSASVATDLVHWLGHRPQVASTMALIRQSLNSQWEPVRVLATDYLAKRRIDYTVPPLISLLSESWELDMIAHVGPWRAGEVVFSATASKEKWHSIERMSYRVAIGPRRLIVTPQINIGRGERVQVARLTVNQFRNDYERYLTDLQRVSLEKQAQKNDSITNDNGRICSVLSRITGQPPDSSPDSWWKLWASLSATDPIVTKQIVEVSEREELPIPAFARSSSCLPEQTRIVTPSGTSTIESIQIGDLVLAKDIDTGELSYKPVIRTTVRSPQPLVTLHTKADSIRATLGHYFWVSGQGWRMAKEIKAGDRLHGVDGTITVTDVSTGGREAVYNLVVEGANTYFVGEGKILSHDVTPPVPTDIIVPGLAAR